MGLPWLKDARVRIEPEGPSLFFLWLSVNIPSILPYLNVYAVSAESFKMLLMSQKRNQVFTVSMVEIDKALRVREHIDL